MKQLFRWVTAAALICMGAVAAQAQAPSVAPHGNMPTGAAVDAHARALADVPAANRWRYRWHAGRWWYWGRSNSWTVYINGRWVPYAELMAGGPPGGHPGHGAQPGVAPSQQGYSQGYSNYGSAYRGGYYGVPRGYYYAPGYRGYRAIRRVF